jgi:hypothetical protein
MSERIIDTTVVVPPYRNGIAWGPVLGGAVVAVAVTALLAAIGSGFGLASLSAYGGDNPSATTFTVMAAVWLLVMQWVSSFFGGYLAGRLRSGLSGIHTDEVTFRDTACGLVSWAAATLFIIGLVGSGAGSLLSGAGHAISEMAGAAAGGAAHSMSSDANEGSSYLVDTMFRSTAPDAKETPAEARAEAGRILATGAVGEIGKPDHDYLVQMVAARTGMEPAEATKRVDAVIATEKQVVEKAKQAAEAARKAALKFALFTGFSMLVGAFIACVAGAIGGRQRDAY